MGFSSFCCRVCGLSIRSYHATPRLEHQWLARLVAITRRGRVAGIYDGHGRILAAELHGPVAERGRLPDLVAMAHEPGSVSVFHHDCWELVGRPGHSGPSPSAPDQGFFVDHRQDVPSPLVDRRLAGSLLRRWQSQHATSAYATISRAR